MTPAQKWLKYGSWIVAGLVALGTLLDTFSNAIALITLPTAIGGTLGVCFSWLIVQLLLHHHPMHWTINEGETMRIKGLGKQISFTLIGVIILLWFPPLAYFLQPEPVPLLLFSNSKCSTCCQSILSPLDLDDSADLGSTLQLIDDSLEDALQTDTYVVAPRSGDFILGIQNISEDNDWIIVDTNVRVSLEKKKGATDLDVINLNCFTPVGGSGEARHYGNIDLASDTENSSILISYEDVDYFLLQPGEPELFVHTFTCNSPGVYKISISINYTFRGNSRELSTQSFNGFPNLVCPESFVEWVIDSGINSSEESTLFASIPVRYKWDIVSGQYEATVLTHVLADSLQIEDDLDLDLTIGFVHQSAENDESSKCAEYDDPLSNLSEFYSESFFPNISDIGSEWFRKRDVKYWEEAVSVLESRLKENLLLRIDEMPPIEEVVNNVNADLEACFFVERVTYTGYGTITTLQGEQHQYSILYLRQFRAN